MTFVPGKNRHLFEAAHAVYGDALRRGLINRWETCEICGSDENVIGHHRDYLYPLDVQWLCRKCHAKAHQIHTVTIENAKTIEELASLMTPAQRRMVIKKLDAKIKEFDLLFPTDGRATS